MNTKSKASNAITDGDNGNRGASSPGGRQEMPSFDTADATKDYSDDDSTDNAAAGDGSAPGGKQEVPSFDTADATKDYSDDD